MLEYVFLRNLEYAGICKSYRHVSYNYKKRVVPITQSLIICCGISHLEWYSLISKNILMWLDICWCYDEYKSDTLYKSLDYHGYLIKWKHFPRYWPFVRGIHRSPVNSSHKGQWRWGFMFPLICVWMNYWVNNCEAGDLRCHHHHYDITVISEKYGC